jgi:hypothetical protein
MEISKMSEPKNFFVGNKYKFTLTGERFKDNEFDVMITGINIPGMQLGLVTHGTSIRQLELPGDSVVFNDISIEFIISENLEEWVTIFEWMEELRNFSESRFNNDIVADGTLVLLTNKNNPNIGLTMTAMFPYNLSDIPLSLNVADGEPVLGEATFKYLDLNIVKNL